MALWQSQMEDHTSDWLRVVSISVCSKVFTRDIYEDHAVSCADIIGKVDIGLGGRGDKPSRPTDMLLYSWEGGLDVCVDLTESSPLMQNGLINFVPVRVVMDAAHRKCVKYEAKCVNIWFSSLFIFFAWGIREECDGLVEVDPKVLCGVTFKHMGLCLTGVCFKTQSLLLSIGMTRNLSEHDGFTLALLESLLSKGLRTVKSIHPKCHLGFSQVFK
nr:hypothetical protein [Tanacetum cinerariifolium]